MSFHDQTIHIGDRSLLLAHPLIDVARIKGGIAVIFDYTSLPKEECSANLFAFDENGETLWRAVALDFPASAYVKFIRSSPLTVWNFACFMCTINIADGTLVGTEFTK